jgi:hypothetical protein
MRISQLAVSFALGLALLTAGSASASGTATSNAGASIVSALSISNTVGLQFGQIAPTVLIGTVTVSTAGARTSSGGVTLGNGIAATAASFAVTGGANSTYAITLPTSITIADVGAFSMAVDTFVSNPLTTGTLSGAGTQTLLVGATLHVGASQTANPYTGTFDVTVAYN